MQISNLISFLINSIIKTIIYNVIILIITIIIQILINENSVINEIVIFHNVQKNHKKPDQGNQVMNIYIYKLIFSKTIVLGSDCAICLEEKDGNTKVVEITCKHSKYRYILLLLYLNLILMK